MRNEYFVTALETLGEKIKTQKDTIYFKDLQIKDLEERVAKAEEKIRELKGE